MMKNKKEIVGVCSISTDTHSHTHDLQKATKYDEKKDTNREWQSGYEKQTSFMPLYIRFQGGGESIFSLLIP